MVLSSGRGCRDVRQDRKNKQDWHTMSNERGRKVRERRGKQNQRFFWLEFTMGWERRRSRPALKLKEARPQTREKRASEVARSTAEVVEGRKEDWASPVLASTGRPE